MITIRNRDDRGHTKIGWLDSHHTFSFGDYRDPNHIGFRSLRVINDDRIIPGAGFSTHGHRDMEIISYVVDGALEHKDSMGNGSVIQTGDVQRMTAGSGVTHSEFNPSQELGARFLQIWIVPAREGLEPGYEQKAFPVTERTNQLRLVADRDAREGAVKVHQDVCLYAASLTEGESVTHTFGPGRHGWVQVVSGVVELNGEEMREGDGAALSEEPAITLSSSTGGEILVFNLA